MLQRGDTACAVSSPCAIIKNDITFVSTVTAVILSWSKPVCLMSTEHSNKSRPIMFNWGVRFIKICFLRHCFAVLSNLHTFLGPCCTQLEITTHISFGKSFRSYGVHLTRPPVSLNNCPSVRPVRQYFLTQYGHTDNFRSNSLFHKNISRTIHIRITGIRSDVYFVDFKFDDKVHRSILHK